jgi:hypothetical protein
LQVSRFDLKGDYIKCILACVYRIYEDYDKYNLYNLKVKLKEAIEIGTFCKDKEIFK